MFISYCRQCGSKNQNDSFKPKFCANCGESFSTDNTRSTAQNISQNSKKPPLKVNVSEDEPEDSDSKDDIDLDNLNLSEADFKIDTTNLKFKKENIKGIILSGTGSVAPIPSVKLPKGHKKKVLEEFKKEAGTLRKN